MISVPHCTKAFCVLAMFAALAGCATHYAPRVPAPTSSAAVPALPFAGVAPATPALPSAPIVGTVEATPAIPVPASPAQPNAPLVPAVSAPQFDNINLLRDWVAQQARLYRVAAPLLINNTVLCPAHARNILGLTAKTQYSYSDSFVADAQSLLGLEERLRVMNMLPGSGAALAGIQTGDFLLKANIEELPAGLGAERAGASLIASEMRGRSSLHLTIARGDTRMAVDVPLTLACAMVIDLGNSDLVNSYSDGHRVMVTRGMIGFAQTDEELAFVLAKEMAHNVLTPSSRPDFGAVIDQLHTLKATPVAADIDTGIAPYAPALDGGADQLAMYMLARAGYEIANVASFCQRLADAYPAQSEGNHTALHPATQYRLWAMDQITKTIAAKRKNSLPLVP